MNTVVPIKMAGADSVYGNIPPWVGNLAVTERCDPEGKVAETGMS
jgi:hypothetical protein